MLHVLRRHLATGERSGNFASGSFVARAKAANDASVLVGPFSSAGKFDSCLERAGMQCLSIGEGSVACELRVNEELSNNFGTLHGGAISTIVDVVGTLALLSKDPTRPGVSIEMNQTFCSAAKLGDRVLMLGTVLRRGRSMGFTEVRLRHWGAVGDVEAMASLLAEQPEEGSRRRALLELEALAGPVVAVGRHTKVFAT